MERVVCVSLNKWNAVIESTVLASGVSECTVIATLHIAGRAGAGAARRGNLMGNAVSASAVIVSGVIESSVLTSAIIEYSVLAKHAALI